MPVSCKQKLIQFNRQVLEELYKLSPGHARVLSNRGVSLGWWDIVSYAHKQGKSEFEVALTLYGLLIP